MKWWHDNGTSDNANDGDVNDDYGDIFSDEVAEFSLTFYTTVEFEEQTDDIPLFVDTAIADMNRSWLRYGKLSFHIVRTTSISW